MGDVPRRRLQSEQQQSVPRRRPKPDVKYVTLEMSKGQLEQELARRDIKVISAITGRLPSLQPVQPITRALAAEHIQPFKFAYRSDFNWSAEDLAAMEIPEFLRRQ